jgi:hypothetical protein
MRTILFCRYQLLGNLSSSRKNGIRDLGPNILWGIGTTLPSLPVSVYWRRNPLFCGNGHSQTPAWRPESLEGLERKYHFPHLPTWVGCVCVQLFLRLVHHAGSRECVEENKIYEPPAKPRPSVLFNGCSNSGTWKLLLEALPFAGAFFFP